jgi:methylenetetrahydrofolate reductase (NADPH)
MSSRRVAVKSTKKDLLLVDVPLRCVLSPAEYCPCPCPCPSPSASAIGLARTGGSLVAPIYAVQRTSVMTHIVDKINDRRRERRRRTGLLSDVVVLERRAATQQHQVQQEQEQEQQDKGVSDRGTDDEEGSTTAPGVAAAGAALEPPPSRPPPPPRSSPDRPDHHHHHHDHLALLPPLYYSFEFFPPKTEAGVRNLQARIERMVHALDPLFVSVTFAPQSYHTSLDLAAYVQRYLGVDVCLHVTCQGMNRLEMKLVLNQAKHAGIQNLLVLRGDPPPGQSRWKQGQQVQGNDSDDDGGGVFPRAIDLVKWIKQNYGDWFGLAVAGHPEGQSVPDPTRTTTTKATSASGGDIPEDKHRPPSSSSSSSSLLTDEEIGHLKEKVDAGADFIVTQFYYDAAAFTDFVRRCRASGIACPIVPGILPVQSYSTLLKMTTYCGVRVPPALEEQVRSVRTNDEQVKDLGCQHAVEMCRTALDICVDDNVNTDDDDDDDTDDSDDYYGGVDGLHFYTLNLERSVTRVLAGLGALDDDGSGGGSPLVPMPTPLAPPSSDVPISVEAQTTTTVAATTSNAGAAAASSRRQLPWRPSALTQRSQERVRPINWANRPRSYVMRTDDWDEFPNGRWGDASSPAFGELSALSHFYSSPVPVAAAPTGAYGYNDGDADDDDDPRRMLGGFPQTHHDLYEVFARYVEGRIPSIPWCESPLQAESFLIQEQLAQLNREGFLTINSQPSVNGAPSSHKTFGWGHPNGYVYQKAYCECFCSPDRVHRLKGVVSKHPSMVLYAINATDAVALTRTNRTRASSIASSKSKTAPLPETVVMVSGDGPSSAALGMMMGDGVTALTWGVFPNKEVIQPTIFDPETFLGVWAEEAFSLWDAWIQLYDPGTASRELLESVRDSYFLCAIVDNDYVSAPPNAAAAAAASAPIATTKTVRGGTADPPPSSAAGPSSNHLWDAMLRSFIVNAELT